MKRNTSNNIKQDCKKQSTTPSYKSNIHEDAMDLKKKFFCQRNILNKYNKLNKFTSSYDQTIPICRQTVQILFLSSSQCMNGQGQGMFGLRSDNHFEHKKQTSPNSVRSNTSSFSPPQGSLHFSVKRIFFECFKSQGNFKKR